MFARFASMIGLLIVLTGCRSTPSASGQDAAATASAGQALIHGEAIYLERIAPPPAAVLSVQLIDSLLADTPAAVLATAEIRDAKGPPFAFELPYDSGRIRTGGQYGLHASLRDAEGRLWFVTDTRVPVVPGDGKLVKFRMVQVDSSSATQDAPHQTQWQCEDQRIGVRFDNVSDSVTLSLQGEPLRLPHALSASGARYADDRGNEFWTKGSRGMLTLAGQDRLDCAQTDQASPWDAARARGVGFRAIGNEPGWWVEVGRGETPALHAELDYGERRLDIARTTADTGGFRGTTGDGTPVELRTRRESCQDPMSGESFPASATLVTGGKTYRGCGRFLFD